MALSKPSNNIKDLLQCGICLMVIQEPKALPCLHSYCLNCLSKWAEDIKDETVQCPLCHQEFPVPADGVQGFITNFVINTLKTRQEVLERLQAKDQQISCSCCGESDTKAEAYCTDCGGFICDGCNSQHRVILCLKSHKTILFDDLQSGKVDINGVIRMQQEHCETHQDQKAEFHCKTCDAVVCDGCTTIDHLDHEFVGLQIAIEEQRCELKRLMTDCGTVGEVVAESLQNIEIVRDNLRSSVEKAKSDLHRVTEKVRARVLADIQSKEDSMLAKIMKAASERNMEIEALRANLLLDQTRFQTALKMAEATQSGTDYNFTLFFSTLRSSMIQLITDTLIEDIDEDLGVIKFNECKSLSKLPKSLGTVSVGSSDEESPAADPPAADGRNFFPWE